MHFLTEELIELLSPIRIEGSFSGELGEIASLECAERGNISFLGNGKYTSLVASSQASLILVPLNFEGKPRDNQVYFFIENPSLALAKICKVIEHCREKKCPSGIHPTAIVDGEAQVHRTASVGPFCVIEEGVVIGENVSIGAHCYIGNCCKIAAHGLLQPRVTLYSFSEIGERVIIHSGSVIGSDGFGYETVGGVHQKLAHIGQVIIEDDVEIGANVTIDRARFAETRIGQGTKIDNLVQIGHNVHIGQGCIIVAQTGIAGSSTIGNYVVLAGQAGIAGHISIGDGVLVAAQSGISSDIEPHCTVRGTPAMPIGEINRFYVLRRHIPKLFHRVDALEKKCAELSNNGNVQ
ncbi:MAG: UDP-3-O-(3-hydroxymyristoyl)glucosamine N-acyltransferase [Puniceicoccales bacterium]|jgi:UDP-3-O-[3-hydroxymyristoyl] glucosamine N-acyltransferase|nr:UDP-3-O-(3-hydroxymyristoyl)glucosamine N-acyltransferase [Puniceicoccales bacterium]